ncbi:SDR family NAD(P)-dependent oxidoreductase [Celeribacter sp. PS-C1]|uniref:SDR family NAD(P)-dependent oxidoreductase n=1 Tax=Celeribacter sp. PS-C1 TaxID=2820813 RepID=UPI001CA539C1|nr:SDR family NAD(P)-dependent oxidoreductase [Celeribacter sp. PS-C1]MBW6419274.1 SDR family NAD(P)-dependent oxidoreductase [Celeribacter sp. PS-C1]
MKALVIGASGGIGAAVCHSFTDQGMAVTGLSRREDGLDVTDPDSVAAHLGALEGPFERVVIATGKLEGAGAPPEKSLRALSAEALRDQFATNAIGPALILRELPRLLPKDAPSVVAVLTARVGSIGDNHLGGWYSYRAAKAAANQLTRTAAIEIARGHKQACLIAYHPGTVATKFTEGYSRDKLSPEGAAGHLIDVMAAREPQDTGRFFDWKGQEVPW